MVRETSYSKAKTKKTALKELQEYSGSLYDESLVDAFKASLNK